jgi:hypothetical protein
MMRTGGARKRGKQKKDGELTRRFYNTVKALRVIVPAMLVIKRKTGENENLAFPSLVHIVNVLFFFFGVRVEIASREIHHLCLLLFFWLSF